MKRDGNDRAMKTFNLPGIVRSAVIGLCCTVAIAAAIRPTSARADGLPIGSWTIDLQIITGQPTPKSALYDARTSVELSNGDSITFQVLCLTSGSFMARVFSRDPKPAAPKSAISISIDEGMPIFLPSRECADSFGWSSEADMPVNVFSDIKKAKRSIGVVASGLGRSSYSLPAIKTEDAMNALVAACNGG